MLAREITAGRLNLDVLAEEDADAAHATLVRHHGIGPWTADVYLLFCLGHGDAWPAGDIAIQEAIKVGLGLTARPTPKQMAPLGEPWRPLRGAAAHLWWAYYKVMKKREGVIAEGDVSNSASNTERCFKQDRCRKSDIGQGKDRGEKKAGIENVTNIQFIVARDDFTQSRFIETPLPEPGALPDEALLVKVDRFAFTANNITYAVLGDALKYWQLFPAPDGFGIVPVWGFGEVISSRHPNIPVGERLFGYFPMASHLVIEAADVSKRGLRDAAAHRQGVAPVYNAYARVGSDPAFAGRQGDYQALLRPLFMLSFLVDDYLAENAFFGAQSVILSSASSKTAFGLAHLLHTLRKPIRVIGLTSQSNADFVTSLGCYDEVVTYDGIEALACRSAGRIRRHGGKRRTARAAAPALWRPAGLQRPDRPDPSRRLRRRNRSARREAAMVFRAGSDPHTRQGMGSGRHRYALWRGMVRLRTKPGSLDQGHRKSRTESRRDHLSRHARWPRAAGPGPHAVTGRIQIKAPPAGTARPHPCYIPLGLLGT